MPARSAVVPHPRPILTKELCDQIAQRQWGRAPDLFPSIGIDKQKYASVRDLVLVDFRNQLWKNSEPAALKNEFASWFRLESCARIAAVGTREMLSAVRLSEKVKSSQCFIVREGIEAYSYMLEVATGLQNKRKPGEYFVLENVRARYANFLLKLGIHGKESAVSVALNWAISDARLIRSIVLRNNLVKPSIGDAAKNLANCNVASKVLVIGDLAAPLLAMVRALGKDNSSVVNEICATTINNGMDFSLQKHLAALVAKKKVVSNVQTRPFREVIKLDLNSFSHIFLTMPMVSPAVLQYEAKLPLEGQLVNNWMKLGASAPILTHVRGPFENTASDTKIWASLRGNSRYIHHDMVQAKYALLVADYEDRLTAARNACVNSALSRSLGLKPVEDRLPVSTDTYASFLGNSRPISAIELRRAIASQAT